MKQLLCVLLFLFALVDAQANSTKDDLNVISKYLSTDIDSAYLLSLEYLEKFEANNDLFGIVRANFYLGYITKSKGDYGKSVIYYLEAIRKSEEADYEGIVYDRISLRKNLANTFRTFQANNLATKYNLEAIEIAIENGERKHEIDIKFNQGLVYQNNNQFIEANNMFLELLPLVQGTEYETKTLNQIGIVYLESKDYKNAKVYFDKLIGLPDNLKLYEAMALHNLGEIHYETGETSKSIQNLRNAIELFESIEDVNKYNYFISLRNIGRYLFEINSSSEAKQFLSKAEEISSYAEWDPTSFEIYKTFSDIYYSEGNNHLGKQYSETYFNKIQEFLKTQEDIHEKDKEYNFDLITKRYFDEVEKQERIASIMFWSKLTSGGLLSVLLLVIAFNRYEKLRLRKTIEQELISLKIID